jgi:hypothetical protein
MERIVLKVRLLKNDHPEVCWAVLVQRSKEFFNTMLSVMDWKV